MVTTSCPQQWNVRKVASTKMHALLNLPVLEAVVPMHMTKHHS